MKGFEVDIRQPGTVWAQIAPKEEEALRWWAGRYVFSHRVEVRLDLPGDRQDVWGPVKGSKEFLRWLNKRLDALLRAALEERHVYPHADVVIEVHEGRFHARATPAASYGYLYVVAWEERA